MSGHPEQKASFTAAYMEDGHTWYLEEQPESGKVAAVADASGDLYTVRRGKHTSVVTKQRPDIVSVLALKLKQEGRLPLYTPL